MFDFILHSYYISIFIFFLMGEYAKPCFIKLQCQILQFSMSMSVIITHSHSHLNLIFQFQSAP